jgi:hypothetical protein
VTSSPAPDSEAPAFDGPDFTPEQYARSKARKLATAPVRYASLAVDLAAVCVLGFTAAGSDLAHAAGKLGGGGWIATALLGAVALRVVLWLLDLPFSLWRERINKDWGLSTRTRGLYWLDALRGFLLGAVLFAAVSLGFFAITRAAPGSWPLIAGAGGVVLVFVALLPAAGRDRADLQQVPAAGGGRAARPADGSGPRVGRQGAGRAGLGRVEADDG